VVLGEIKDQPAFLGLKNQPPIQARSALENLLSELADRNPRVHVWFAKALLHQFESGRNLRLATVFPDDPLEPARQFNRNHSLRR